MKIKTAAITTIAALSIALSANAAVSVNFENPDNFSDISLDSIDSKKDQQIVLKDLEKYMTRKLDKKIGDQYIASVNVTDVDLAGEIEPWRSRLQDVRIVKSIYPASIAFEYQILDLDGNVVAQGEENLRDRNVMTSITHNFEDYPYVKDLYDTWVRKLKV
ncbi:DUF3016 domain-containing protein [Pelagicoccus mobilis]|uniref:DUF3016 domain-containing protein n=1 Tax=Pelagicoccus mobilis TaxID=415221 RepID=A0A934RYT5_9BACT|nr:DUF3016 domain-containing protein [Pelagicoccus mobilis]MBK1876822.1 DUF3016 domain-containing protein [Pelagicoccus mobilis]